MTGIAYNIKATGRELGSVNDLFDPAYKGRIGMLTEMRDTVGLMLLGEGIDPSTITTFKEAEPAFEKLAQAKSDGVIRAFTGNDYLDDLSQGNFAACVGWSGDVLQLQLDNPDCKFVIPEEGGMRWADTMVWVKGSNRRDAVATWMNYVYDPVNAARITAEVQYIPPVQGVQEVFASEGGDASDLANNPLLFPTGRRPRPGCGRSPTSGRRRRRSTTTPSPGSRGPDVATTIEPAPAPTPAPEPEAPAPTGLRAQTARHADVVGLGALILVGIAVIAIGAGWATGPAAVVVLVLALAVVIGFIVAALTADPETRRRLAPYGLLKPGILWLCPVLPGPAVVAARHVALGEEGPLRLQPQLRLALRELPPGLHRLRAAVRAGLRVRRVGDRLHDPDRLPDRLRDRLPRREVPQPAARPGRHPVLHLVPDPDDRLAGAAGGPGTGGRVLRPDPPDERARDASTSWTTAGCSTRPRR